MMRTAPVFMRSEIVVPVFPSSSFTIPTMMRPRAGAYKAVVLDDYAPLELATES